jgi:hypothetical protein
MSYVGTILILRSPHREILGPNRDNVMGNEGSYTVRSFIICTHPQISLGRSSQANEVGRACCTHGRGAYKVLVEKPEGKRPFVRPRLRWEDGIRIDLMEIGWGRGLDSTGSG